MTIEVLTTERLKLRKITPEVLAFVFDKLTTRDQLNFLGLSTEKQRLEEEKKYREGHTTHNKSFLYFQLILPETDKVIGWCGFHTWYLDHDRAEIGYGLFQDESKGKRYMSEAIAVIINYGFETMKLHRIEALISPANTPSIKLARRLKFIKEGYLKEHYKNKGTYEDSLVFALLNKK